MSELENLLSYLKSGPLAKKAASAVFCYSADKPALKIAESILADEELIIDISEMESLVNPDKFEFPNESIGLVGIDESVNEVI